jgi:hypothetical protein
MFGCGKSPEEKRNAYLESAKDYRETGKAGRGGHTVPERAAVAPDDAQTSSAGRGADQANRPRRVLHPYSKASKTDGNIKAREYLASSSAVRR